MTGENSRNNPPHTAAEIMARSDDELMNDAEFGIVTGMAKSTRIRERKRFIDDPECGATPFIQISPQKVRYSVGVIRAWLQRGASGPMRGVQKTRKPFSHHGGTGDRSGVPVPMVASNAN